MVNLKQRYCIILGLHMEYLFLMSKCKKMQLICVFFFSMAYFLTYYVATSLKNTVLLLKIIIPISCILTAWLMCDAGGGAAAGLVATATWLPPTLRGFADCWLEDVPASCSSARDTPIWLALPEQEGEAQWSGQMMHTQTKQHAIKLQVRSWVCSKECFYNFKYRSK